MKIGDTVRYSTEWLQSTSSYFGPIPFARGKVVEIETSPSGEFTAATVKWSRQSIEGGMPGITKVLVKNLEVC